MKPPFTLSRLALAGVIAVACAGFGSFGASSLVYAQPAPPPALVAGSNAVAGLPNFTALVQRYGPTVVNISTTVKQQRQMQLNGIPFGQDDPFQFFRGFSGPMGPAREEIMHGLGSGFIISQDGYILTNAHVVEDATEVTVKLTDRREFRAKVVGIDKRSDIAVIRIDAKNLPVVTLGNADNLQVGEWVLAIGSPFGFENTVTSGIVSAKARTLGDEEGSPHNVTPFIQTDVPINPGNSGGPLFNLNGEVVGINARLVTGSGAYEGLSFAIPINIAMHVKDELIAHGKVTRGQLGVQIQDVDQQLANSFGLPRPMGALVGVVVSDEPAAAAGVKTGDVITRINGHDVERASDLQTMVADIKPGTRAQLQVWRNGKPVELTATIAELSDDKEVASAQTGPNHGKLGLGLRELAPRERSQIGEDSGLVVEAVGGPAESAGIHRGDVILAINDTPLKSVQQLRDIASKAKGSIALLVWRNGQKHFVPLELD